MDNKEEFKKLEIITGKIVKKYSPERIILFGSRSQGKANKDSDFDLFIIKKTKKNKVERQRELRLKLFPPGIPIDLLIYTPEEIKKRLESGDFFIRDILKKGKTLYVESK